MLDRCLEQNGNSGPVQTFPKSGRVVSHHALSKDRHTKDAGNSKWLSQSRKVLDRVTTGSWKMSCNKLWCFLVTLYQLSTCWTVLTGSHLSSTHSSRPRAGQYFVAEFVVNGRLFTIFASIVNKMHDFHLASTLASRNTFSDILLLSL